MKKTLWTLAVVLFFSWQAFAQNQVCNRRYQVAVNNYAPFFSRDKNNHPEGITHDMVLDLQKRLGCTFMEKELFRPAAVEHMKGGRLDMVLLVLQGAEFGSSAEFVSLYKVKREVVVLKDHYAKDRNVESYINDKKMIFGNIIGTRTALTQDEEKMLLKSRRLMEAVDYQSLFELLGKGRIQALALTSFVNSHYLKKSKIEDKVVRIVDEDNVTEVGVYFSIRRMDAEERLKIQKALQDMVEDGSFAKMLAKYMSKTSLGEVTR
ncbi:substrate-binding periplasmic protein [Bdellovibrio sp. HCB2-146]|uniref:substrate-binding periplasmic protein n=1 Tax=Bdellovibrio sp. HCB2-146 TaxID=3394362 RepID=UPI0039BCC7A5